MLYVRHICGRVRSIVVVVCTPARCLRYRGGSRLYFDCKV